MRATIAAFLLASLLGGAAQAAVTTVTAVNMPAWIERGGHAKPLAPGMVLESADVIRTGAGARVLLALPEGSAVKLGENAVFRAETLGNSDGTRSPFAAVLEVVKGAFRFTTTVLAKHRDRDVQVRVATITAGIRGTDVWGKSDDSKDLVCLLEGKIAVSHEGEAGSQTMDEALSFYVAPKGQPAKPISKVDPAKVANEWSPQTEPQAGQGLAQAGGRWKLTAATVATQAEALQWYDTLQQAGYAARIRPVSAEKFAVRVEGLASEADAEALGAQLKAALNTPESMVGR